MPPSPKHSVDSLRARLRAARHGGIEIEAIDQLRQLAEHGSRQAIDAIVEHAAGDRGIQRAYAASTLAQLAGAVKRAGFTFRVPSTVNPEWTDIFERLLADPTTKYWAIAGLAHVGGRDAYRLLAGLALDSDNKLDCRAQAVKCLARSSGQLFDRGLASDPGHWKEVELRLDEVRTWAMNGFPPGPGHALPPRDAALDNPVTRLEQLAARLERLLVGEREKRFYGEDTARPALRLTPASEADIAAISRQWTLPSLYLEFLRRFSPLRVTLLSDEFWNGGLSLYGASELLERQKGYAWNPDPLHPLDGWRPEYVVVADHGADPFVFDLGHTDGNDAPILTAEHGAGTWDFEEFSPSFEAFLLHLIGSATST
jgi:hypothetical protein